MKKITQLRNKKMLLLLSAIAILCAGFIIIGCANGPQTKSKDADAGAYAIDFSICPDTACHIILYTLSDDGSSSLFKDDPSKQIEDKELTLEAWVKFKTDDEPSAIFGRMDSGGAALYTRLNSSTSVTTPRFMIRRVANVATDPGTSTVEHFVDSGVDVSTILNVWTHIAGVLVDEAHTHPVSASCTVAAMAERPHMDMYINGNFTECATTFGNVANSGDPDDMTTPSFAHEPAGANLFVGAFNLSGDPIGQGNDTLGPLITSDMSINGIIDETRLWTTARTQSQIELCRWTELDSFSSGDCGALTDNLVAYFRFNEGEGIPTMDRKGLGAGRKESLGTPTWTGWTTGWTTDTPSLTRAE